MSGNGTTLKHDIADLLSAFITDPAVVIKASKRVFDVMTPYLDRAFDAGSDLVRSQVSEDFERVAQSAMALSDQIDSFQQPLF